MPPVRKATIAILNETQGAVSWNLEDEPGYAEMRINGQRMSTRREAALLEEAKAIWMAAVDSIDWHGVMLRALGRCARECDHKEFIESQIIGICHESLYAVLTEEDELDAAESID